MSSCVSSAKGLLVQFPGTTYILSKMYILCALEVAFKSVCDV